MKTSLTQAVSVEMTVDEVQQIFEDVIKQYNLPLRDFQFIMQEAFTTMIPDVDDTLWTDEDMQLSRDSWMGLIEELEHNPSDDLLTFLMLQCIMRDTKVFNEVKNHKAILISCEPTRKVLMSYRTSQLLN